MSDVRSNTAKCIHAGKPGAEGVAWARNENRSSHTYNRRRWMTTWAVKIGASRATRLSSDKITEEALKLMSNASKITLIVHISTRKIKISHIFSGEVGR